MDSKKCDKCEKPAEYKHTYGATYCRECLIKELGLEPVFCDCCGKEIESKPLMTEEGFDCFMYFCSIDCAIKYYKFEKIGSEK